MIAEYAAFPNLEEFNSKRLPKYCGDGGSDVCSINRNWLGKLSIVGSWRKGVVFAYYTRNTFVGLEIFTRKSIQYLSLGDKAVLQGAGSDRSPGPYDTDDPITQTHSTRPSFLKGCRRRVGENIIRDSRRIGYLREGA